MDSIRKSLKNSYPDARLELNYSNLFELLIATILSAQSTDKKINEVTNTLFKKYKRPEDYVKAPLDELEASLKPTGFYRQKTKTVRACCERIVKEFGGKVPETVEEIVTLPGVGRKTANMVLGNACGVPGIAVDRHVTRVIGRLGLTDESDPEKIEFALQKLIPTEEWVWFSNALILHGRYICTSSKPLHEKCVLRSWCPYKDE